MSCSKFQRVFLALCKAGAALFLLGLLELGGCADKQAPRGGDAGGGGGGGGSNPTPSIAFLDPNSAAAGGPDFYLTAYGSGFSSSSSIQWNGLKLSTTFVNSTQVFVIVPGGYRSTSGSPTVTVFNPVPGGGTSNAMSVLVGTAPAPPQGIGVIQLVSAGPDGTPGNGNTYTPPALSADGRYVAFQSDSTNLVAGTASGFTDIYIRDTCLGAPTGCAATTMRVSVANDGSLPNGNSRSPAISANGRYVAFDSSASNLFPGSTQTNGYAHVFLRDTCIGAPASCIPSTSLISVASDGTQANNDSRGAAISSDGRFVAFVSSATNLVPNDTNNGFEETFLRDTCLGAPSCIPTTTRVSVANDGSQANGPSGIASISADARYMTFVTGATNLVPNDPKATVVLHDTCFGAATGCAPSNRSLFVGYAGNSLTAGISWWRLSANGRFSAFDAETNNLVPGGTGQIVGAFVYDDCVAAPVGCIPHTDQVSLTYNGGQPDSGSGAAVASNDGNYVVFVSIADNLLSYAYRSSAVYVRVTCANGLAGCIPTTYLLSFDGNTGIQGNSSYSDYPAITPDGHYAVFISNAPNWPGKLQSNGNNQTWLARVY